MLSENHSPLQEISLPDKNIRLFVKRDDLLHPHISGNKWRKLKYNLREMQRQGKETLLTFGGAYSNHIAATAAVGKKFQIKTIGIIRGEETKELNSTLALAKESGMQLVFVSRADYRKKSNLDFQEKLKKQFGKFYMLPEGGTNQFALPGCAEIISETDIQADYWCVAAGTGGTAAGMIQGLKPNMQLLAFSSLKGDFLKEEISGLLNESEDSFKSNWSLQTDYHFGGYAKFRPELIEFINTFSQKYGIALDPIYTGKMFYGIFDLLKKGYFSDGSKIIAVHTGGLQGIQGFNQRYGNLIK